MTTDSPADLDGDPVVDPIETSPEAETVEPQPEVVLPPPPAPAPAPTIPKEVLRAVFNKRTIDNVDPELWDKSMAAVQAGYLVVLRGSAPHLEITTTKFDADAPLPAGVPSSVSVLNNLVAGMF
jgi:hypothetical protein